MAAADYYTQVYTMFVGYYGRPPAKSGLDYYADLVDKAGGNLAVVIDDFFKSAESQAFFAGKTVEQQVNQIFQNLFGRDALPAGLNYWTNLINNGTVALAQAAYTIANNAAAADIAVRDAKVASAMAWVAGLDTTNEILVYGTDGGRSAGRDFLTSVNTSTPATQAAVDAALKAMVDGGTSNPGQTFTLTTGVDNVAGTSGNDTILGYVNYTALLGQTLSSADVIDGGAGTDNLFVTVEANSLNNLNLNVKNVEVLKVRDLYGEAFNLGSVTGLQRIEAFNSDSSTSFDSVGNVVDIAITNPTDAYENVRVYYNLNGVAATSTQKVILEGTDVSGGDYQYVEAYDNNTNFGTYDIVSQGGANGLYVYTDNATKTLKVSGTADLYLDTSSNAKLKTVDASGMSGAFEFDAGGSSEALTITGGKGDDTIFISGAAGSKAHTVALGAGNDLLAVGAALDNFAASTLDGGDGTDIINIADGANLTKTTAAYIKNFEILDVAGGTGTYDMSLYAFTGIQIDEAVGGAAGIVTIDKAASTFTFDIKSDEDTDSNFTAATAVTINIKDAATGKADALTLNSLLSDGNNDSTDDGNVTLTALTADDVETLTLNSSVVLGDTGVKLTNYSTTISTLTMSAVKTVNITGDASVDVTALINSGNTLTKVDAGTSTGNVTLDLSGLTSQVAYTGSAGKDAYTATNGGSIFGGKGNDAIDLVSTGTDDKADTIIYKAATDVSFKDSGSGKIASAGGIETITGFTTAATAAAGANVEADTVDLTTFGLAGYARGAVSKGVFSATVEGGTFDFSIANFFADAAGDRGAAFGTSGTDTYVFVDANGDGDWNAGTDLAIKLAGVTDFAVTSLAF